MVDLLCVPGHDDVTHEHSCARCRSFGIYTHDENTAPAAWVLSVFGSTSDPHGLQASAEISSEYMALGQKLINGAVDRRCRNSECAATRTEDCHADDLSLHVD